MPVLAGAGGYDTTRSHSRSPREMQKAGADGLLSVTPYYNKPTQEGLYQHYRAIAESTPLPIVRLQRAGPHRRATSSRRRSCASRSIPNIVGVKEASGNMTQMCEICRAVPPGLHRAVRRRCADAAADGGRRPRHHFGRVERDSRRDGRRWSKRPSAATSPRRAPSTTRILPLMQINFVESNPVPGEGRDGGDGPARGGVPAADGARPKPESQEKIVAVLKDLGLLKAAR